MKISVDVDCTPEEARRFMGLPDLSSIHQAYIDRMRSAIDQGGLSPDFLQSLTQSWGPMSEAGVAMWRQMFEQIGAATDKR